VGRLSPEKNCAGLVRAVVRLTEQGLSPTLLFVGEGPERQAIERAAADLGPAVRLLGLRQDIPRLLAAADVFALASLSEGISIAILEAMASGLPVVATRVGGNPEIVAQEQSGLLVSPGRPDELAQAIMSLLREPERGRAMGRTARASAGERFSLERTASAYADLYAEVSREGRRGT
jgi:glycosyltransferase involved in cell wall biosynthesis